MKKNLLLPLLLLAFALQAQPTKTDVLKQKAITLKRFLEKNHYQSLVWNDTSSAILYHKWIEELDEEKLFFTSNDIALLGTYKTKLDDELKGGDWKFFTASVNIYQQRLKKTDSIIKMILGKPLDFSKPDNIVWPNAGYAATEIELQQCWQRYIKWQVLKIIADDITDDDKELSPSLPAGFAILEASARAQVKQQEDRYIKNLTGTPALFTANMQDAYLNAIACCYDPHSSYMNINKKNEFETAMSAAEYSAGFDLEEDEKGDKTIGFLQPGGSAWRSGKLHKGDVLVKIKMNGQEKNSNAIELNCN